MLLDPSLNGFSKASDVLCSLYDNGDLCIVRDNDVLCSVYDDFLSWFPCLTAPLMLAIFVSDLHLILNLVNGSSSFQTAESWTPICLPRFDSR